MLQSYIQYSKTGNFYIFGINNNQTFVSKVLTVLGPLGDKFNFFNPLGFGAESDFDHKTSKIKSNSIRASERYLNNKTQIYCRETASTFRFSAETFESDFMIPVFLYFVLYLRVTFCNNDPKSTNLIFNPLRFSSCLVKMLVLVRN